MYKISHEREYSKSQIKSAGKVITGLVYRSPEVEEAFRIAHNWRLHHAYPMVRERAKLTKLVKPAGGITAGRLKRMSSIRKKLVRSPVRLEQMQDLVGCRGILKDMNALNEVLSNYETIENGGRVHRRIDYIASPKPLGYRSVHLIIKFDEKGIGLKHKGCTVEIQLRTQLQHVWATTVEAIGSMRNEDLKAGEGNPEWLRFMSLMSGHMAELEGQPRGEHLPQSCKEVRAEAVALADQLNVKASLNTFSEFMNEAESHGGFDHSRYTLKMNAKTGTIEVSPTWRDLFDYDDLEDDDGEEKQSIEVSVDNMQALRQAYPNYFLDTREFITILDDMSVGKIPATSKGLDKLDYSFLNKTAMVKAPAKVSLDYTGFVFWRGVSVGRWEKGYYGTYTFRPNNEASILAYDGIEADFIENIRSWLIARENGQRR